MSWMSITEAAKAVPTTNGKTVACATIWRWCTKGIKGVRLKHGKAGRRVVINLADLDDFFRACATAENDPVQSPLRRERRKPAQRTPEQREAAAKAAEERLRARGIGA